MNELFFDLLDCFVLVYLDDILIYSATEQDHKDHLEIVLHRLDSEGFKLKCQNANCLTTN